MRETEGVGGGRRRPAGDPDLSGLSGLSPGEDLVTMVTAAELAAGSERNSTSWGSEAARGSSDDGRHSGRAVQVDPGFPQLTPRLLSTLDTKV